MLIRAVRQAIQGNLLFTIFINLGLAILSLVSGSMAARFLGVSGRGELAAIQTWPSLLASFCMLGLSEAIVYFTARDSQRGGQYLMSAMALTLLASLPFMVVGYLALPVVLAAQSPVVIRAAREYLWMIPLLSLIGLPIQALRGRGKFFTWNWMRLLQPIGWILVLGILGIRGYKSAEGYALAYLGVVGILILPSFYIASKRISGPFLIKQDLWKPMLRFGIPSVSASIPKSLNLRLDQLLMAAFLPVDILGLYVVAVAWASAASPILSAISMVIFPKIASQPTNEDGVKVFVQGVHLALLFGVALIILLWIVTPFFIPFIFGQEFRPAITAALILVVAGVVASLNTIFEESARGLGKPLVAFTSECVGLLGTIILLALLLRPMGILGASIASLIGYSCTLIALCIQITRITGQPVSKLLVPTMPDILFIFNQMRNLFGSKA